MSASAETPLLFDCEGERLVGMVHAAPGTLGVVVVVGGPQVRAGSHRHFVSLARTLAAQGHPALRFDMRGMGDSTGPLQTFEQLTPDIGAAIDALQHAQPQVDRVVLWGLCDAASAALLYLHDRRDRRVAGLCLANPWVRSTQTLAKARVRHYYLQRLLQPSFWGKLLRGGVGLGAGRDLVRQAVAAQGRVATPIASFTQRMREAWARFDGPVLLLLSGRDLTAREFTLAADADPAWRTLLVGPRTTRIDLQAADHTFSTSTEAQSSIQQTVAWLAVLARPMSA